MPIVELKSVNLRLVELLSDTFDVKNSVVVDAICFYFSSISDSDDLYITFFIILVKYNYILQPFLDQETYFV